MSKQHNRKGCYDDVILPSSGREAICAHWPYADTGLTTAIKKEETISASPQQVSLRLQQAKQVILQWMGYKSDLLIHLRELCSVQLSVALIALSNQFIFFQKGRKSQLQSCPWKSPGQDWREEEEATCKWSCRYSRLARMLQRIAAGW